MPIFAKVNASMPWHDKVAVLSDGEFRAFVKLICAAKQRESGEFTEPALIDVLGAHAKHAKALLKARLLDEIAVRKYALHDFDEHQSPYDATAKVRQRRAREKRRKADAEHESDGSPQVDNGVDNVTVTRDMGRDVTRDAAVTVTRDVTEQSRAESKREREVAPSAREGPETTDDVPDEESELTALVDALVIANVWRRPTKKMIGFLANLIRDHGQSNVEQEASKLLKGKAIPDDFMGELANRLRSQAEERSDRNAATKVEADRKRIEHEQENIERIRKQPGAEETAAERRKAIADFASGLGSPPTPRPRGTTEGRQSA